MVNSNKQWLVCGVLAAMLAFRYSVVIAKSGSTLSRIFTLVAWLFVTIGSFVRAFRANAAT